MYSFSKCEIHQDLTILSNKSDKKVIGYVNRDPNENAWFFIHGSFISELYSKKDDAIEGLFKWYIQKTMDNMFYKKGLLYNEKYVKGL